MHILDILIIKNDKTNAISKLNHVDTCQQWHLSQSISYLKYLYKNSRKVPSLDWGSLATLQVHVQYFDYVIQFYNNNNVPDTQNHNITFWILR